MLQLLPKTVNKNVYLMKEYAKVMLLGLQSGHVPGKQIIPSLATLLRYCTRGRSSYFTVWAGN